MVSYARARAESLIPLCKVGFMERPERLVLLIIGGLVNRMGPVLWVIPVVSTLTVIHRIYYTWRETKAGRLLPRIKLSLSLYYAFIYSTDPRAPPHRTPPATGPLAPPFL